MLHLVLLTPTLLFVAQLSLLIITNQRSSLQVRVARTHALAFKSRASSRITEEQSFPGSPVVAVYGARKFTKGMSHRQRP